MRFFDSYQKSAFFIFLGLFIGGSLVIAARDSLQADRCIPYKPTSHCKLSHYEIRIYDITRQDSPIIAVAEGNCVYTIGEGRYKRYAMSEATFTAANRTDYIDRGIEIPADQSMVCEVR